MAAAASARPDPETLSGWPPPFSETALFTIRFRSVVRAATASSAAELEPSRHGAACIASAAIPATCGAAADVPKKVDGNPPAPVTETPSIADTSGFCRPSSVGPRLLKNSTVEFVVSTQDGLGLPRNRSAAAADAEQIAPTEITDTGDPPASLCAETLRVAVL